MKLQQNRSVSKVLTLDQAAAMAESLRYLEGTSVNDVQLKIDGTIVAVTAAPFDELNRFIFLEYFKELRDPEAALQFYQVPFYDVVMIVRKIDGDSLEALSVLDILERTNLFFRDTEPVITGSVSQ